MLEIINNTDEGRKNYGHHYGYSHLELTDKHMKALNDGYCLAYNDGEYATFISRDMNANEEIDKIIEQVNKTINNLTYAECAMVSELLEKLKGDK